VRAWADRARTHFRDKHLEARGGFAAEQNRLSGSSTLLDQKAFVRMAKSLELALSFRSLVTPLNVDIQVRDHTYHAG